MDLVILNNRASRVQLIDITCLPAELKLDEATGGNVVAPSRTACTEVQAAAIKAHRPSMKLFEAKVLKWGKTEAAQADKPEAKPEAKQPEAGRR
jgi:hypothetical protein